ALSGIRKRVPNSLRSNMAHVHSPLSGRYIIRENIWIMDTTSKSTKYNQIKWLYSALSGLCAAYFLALFSAGQALSDSISLQIATILFAMCLPVFTTFSIAHIYMIEANLSTEVADKALNADWVGRVTIGAFICLLLAFCFLIAHFSIVALIGFVLVTTICFVCFAEFTNRL
ncbi:hypothetical protein, partial [Vibrio mexicanus]|uniref:hypothetical protein n=1 Tax=Vibrio mexicanus TaxID=1004326 RepID=UPI000AF87A66